MASKAPTWHPKIQKFRTSLEKRTKVRDVFVEASYEIKYINTGSTTLNMSIGGSRLPNGKFICPGWPRGHIIEVFGRESSGKSTVALTACGQAAAAGLCALYIDLECAVKDYYAIKLGADFRSPELGGSGLCTRAQPRTFEETEAIILNAALQGMDVIVVDSVAALVSGREMKRDTSDDKQKQGIAEVPRLMANFLPKLQRIIAETGTIVIFTNQTRDKIGAIGYTEEALKSTTGGNALKFYAALRISLKPKRSAKAQKFNPITKEREDIQISTDVEFKMIKNKIDAKQGHTGMFTIRYGVGIDELRTMLNVAEAYQIVKSTKNAKKQDVFVFKSPTTGTVVEGIGIEKFRMAMQRQPELLNEMIDLGRNKIVEGYRMIDDEELAALAEDAVVSENHDDNDDFDYEEAEKAVPETTDYGEILDKGDGTVDLDV